MAQISPWTHRVSDHLMDAQSIAMRAVREDGIVTATEQAMLDAMVAAQETITEVHREIVDTEGAMRLVVNAMRYGMQPKRLRARNDEPRDAA